MIYLYHGTSHAENVRRAKTLVDALFKKRPNASLTKVGDNEITENHLEELLSSSALFEKRNIIFAIRALEEAGTREVFAKYVKKIGQSEHIFVFVEETIPAPLFKKIQTYAEKVVTNEGKKAGYDKEKGRSSYFGLTDAVGRRDSLLAWRIFQELRRGGSSVDEIFPLLWWQIKSLLVAQRLGRGKGRDALKIGMKPYPFEKSLGFLERGTWEDLEDKAREMVTVYKKARRGELELELGTERFLLSL